MKKFVTFILLMCMVLSLAACGKVEITMQEIFDANRIEALLNNHQSILIRCEMDGMFFYEKYLTKEYSYVHYPDEKFNFAQFMTDDASYAFSNGDYLCYLYITPDGVTNDFASDRADIHAPVLTEDVIGETIESVSKKDGRITVNSFLGEEILAVYVESGVTSGKTEYTLDAKTHELISVINDYSYNDGTVFQSVTEVAYDEDAPEMLETFLKYANQTENLRNVTIVMNPGAEKEISQDFRIPKGLIVGFSWADAFENMVELYIDAACTELYDPYVNTDADLTVYVKWLSE